MSRNKVEICNVNTANIKVLTNEEMTILFKKLKDGDLSAKEELINGNLKLVLSILKKYNNRVDNMDDLFQVGCIGLIKAIDNFDLKFDVKFSTYAVPMILGEVRRYLRDSSSIRVARSIKDTAYKIMKLKEELTNKLGKEPSIKMISEKLGITEFEVANAMDAMKDTVSMFEPIYNDGGDTIYLEDQLDDKSNNMYSLDMKISLKDALNKLKEKEKYILIERYITGKTQLELAEEIGISQAQISRLEKSGLENIKKMIN
ncbi:MAG: SigB/SigF/SigG family RNA polymerase sigma factor [Lactobacillales bacterium]|nr:SigB/SigF/SigG family RNA polymerase sigma factor [Lactobacillales bacterium]